MVARDQRFTNRSGKTLTVVVEPWAEEFTVNDGSDFVIGFDPAVDQEQEASIELREFDSMAVWLPGNTWTFELDGKLMRKW